MKKVILIMSAAFVMLFGNVLTADAAPKMMIDGKIFDAEFYAQTYPDVMAALGTDENALYRHYQTNGISEGRSPYAPGTDLQKIPTVAPVIHKESCVNKGLMLPVIGKIGVFSIDGTYSMVVDCGNPPPTIVNNEGSIVISMYEGTTINLNYQQMGTLVPAFAGSQNGFVQGETTFDGFALSAVTPGADVVIFNIYADATHTMLLSQVPVTVNVLPAQISDTSVNTVQIGANKPYDEMTWEEKIAFLRQVLAASQNTMASAKFYFDGDGNITAENDGTVFSFEKNTGEFIRGYYNNKGNFIKLEGNAGIPYHAGGWIDLKGDFYPYGAASADAKVGTFYVNYTNDIVYLTKVRGCDEFLLNESGFITSSSGQVTFDFYIYTVYSGGSDYLGVRFKYQSKPTGFYYDCNGKFVPVNN